MLTTTNPVVDRPGVCIAYASNGAGVRSVKLLPLVRAYPRLAIDARAVPVQATPAAKQQFTQTSPYYIVKSDEERPLLTAPVVIGAGCMLLVAWQAFQKSKNAHSSREVSPASYPDAQPVEPGPSALTPAERWLSTKVQNMDVVTEQKQEEADISRVILCARLLPEQYEQHQSAMSQLVASLSAGPGSEPISGVMISYGSCAIHVLEGDHSALCAALAQIRPDTADTYMVQEARVISYVMTTSGRLFSRWYAASAGPAFKYRTVGSTPSGTTAQDCIKSIQSVELFLRILAAKVEATPDEVMRQEALDNVGVFESSLPPLATVVSLTSAQAVPSVPDFMAEYDSEYQRYRALLASGTPDDSPDMQRLSQMYARHLVLEEQQQQAAAEAKAEAEAMQIGSTSSLARFYPQSTTQSRT